MKISSLSTKDVLRIMPLDKEIRMKLLDIYPDKVTYERGVQIEDLTWKLFYEYFDVVYDSLLRKEIEDHPGPLAPGFQELMLEKTEEHILKDYHTDATNVELEELRKKLGALTNPD